MSKNSPIGVLDSGLGGLSAVKELIRAFPNEDIVYFGDTGRVPYGTRSKDTIERYAKQDARFLMTKNVKLILAACGTISSVVPHIGDELPVPFVCVVDPSAQAASKASKTGRIGVIATPATIRSKAYSKNLLKLNPDFSVFEQACPLLVPLVEEGWISRDDDVTRLAAMRYLKPLIDAKVDTLILGCTHYPAISDIIADIMGKNVTLISAGQASAMCAGEMLKSSGMLSDKNVTGETRYYVSDRTEGFATTAEILLGRAIYDNVFKVDIESY